MPFLGQSQQTETTWGEFEASEDEQWNENPFQSQQQYRVFNGRWLNLTEEEGRDEEMK